MTTRVAFQAATRAAAVEMLNDFAASVGITLQVYPGRPKSIYLPSAFVDRLTETLAYPGGVTWRQRTPRVEVIVLHGMFDSADAVAQKDAFVDGFIDWATDHIHAAGASTTIGVVAVEDEPTYVPDWIPPDRQQVYYATRITLEGFAGG